MSLSIKEQILKYLYHVGVADRIQIANGISEKFNKSGIGTKEKSVENELKVLKDFSYTDGKLNDVSEIEFIRPYGNKKEVYKISDYELKKHKVFTLINFNYKKTNVFVNYINDIINKNYIGIDLDNVFNNYIFTFYNKNKDSEYLNIINDKYKKFDLMIKLPNKKRAVIYVDKENKKDFFEKCMCYIYLYFKEGDTELEVKFISDKDDDETNKLKEGIIKLAKEKVVTENYNPYA